MSKMSKWFRLKEWRIQWRFYNLVFKGALTPWMEKRCWGKELKLLVAVENHSNGSCSGLWDFSAVIMQKKIFFFFLYGLLLILSTQPAELSVQRAQLRCEPRPTKCSPLQFHPVCAPGKVIPSYWCTENKINTCTSEFLTLTFDLPKIKGQCQKSLHNLEHHQNSIANRQTNEHQLSREVIKWVNHNQKASFYRRYTQQTEDQTIHRLFTVMSFLWYVCSCYLITKTPGRKNKVVERTF